LLHFNDALLDNCVDVSVVDCAFLTFLVIHCVEYGLNFVRF